MFFYVCHEESYTGTHSRETLQLLMCWTRSSGFINELTDINNMHRPQRHKASSIGNKKENRSQPGTQCSASALSISEGHHFNNRMTHCKMYSQYQEDCPLGVSALSLSRCVSPQCVYLLLQSSISSHLCPALTLNACLPSCQPLVSLSALHRFDCHRGWRD